MFCHLSRWWVLLAPLALFLLSGCDDDDDDDVTPLAGRIAFYSNFADLDRDDIFVIGVNGTGLTRLTDSSRIRNWSPAFSPNGTFVAFRGENAEQFGDIYRVAPNGTGETLLTPGTVQINDIDPAVNAGSTRIAFASDRDGNFEIYEMDADDGGNLVRLTNNSAQDTGPAYAPDGRIVFVSDRDGNPEIYIMNANGSNQIRLTNNAVVDTAPTVNPLGNRIAFESGPLAGPRNIFTMNLNGTGVTQHTTVDSRHPTYSPDGNWLAYASGGDIVARPVVGGSIVNITGDLNSADFEPSWGP